MNFIYIEEYFSFCLDTLFCFELGLIFSNNRKYFVIRQAFASIQHGFFRSAENADLHNLIDVIGEGVVFLFAKNYNLFLMKFGWHNGLILTIVV